MCGEVVSVNFQHGRSESYLGDELLDISVGIILITSTEVRKLAHCGWHHSLARNPGVHKQRRVLSTSTHSSLLPDGGYNVNSSSLNSQIGAKVKDFILQLVLSVFDQDTRKRNKDTANSTFSFLILSLFWHGKVRG